ncbi:hypothetical protein HDU82_006072 [Entophlyctis luteolus]|nr:hypothetical protein HDU82_006072 [Entophlyctis luteolus]
MSAPGSTSAAPVQLTMEDAVNRLISDMNRQEEQLAALQKEIKDLRSNPPKRHSRPAQVSTILQFADAVIIDLDHIRDTTDAIPENTMDKYNRVADYLRAGYTLTESWAAERDLSVDEIRKAQHRNYLLMYLFIALIMVLCLLDKL